MTYRRMQTALEELSAFKGKPGGIAFRSPTLKKIVEAMRKDSHTGAKTDLVDSIEAKKEDIKPELGADNKTHFVNERLNPLQKEAVTRATETDDFYLVHGPPGTGKTVTLVEICLQLILRKQKVVFCGPSNSSVDNFLNKLLHFLDNFIAKQKLKSKSFSKLGSSIAGITERAERSRAQGAATQSGPNWELGPDKAVGLASALRPVGERQAE